MIAALPEPSVTASHRQRRRPATRHALGAILSLAYANACYWHTVAPLCSRELRRWECHARTICDPAQRELALGKLHNEGFNAQVAATLATLAPRVVRPRTVTAIVALEVVFDFLDGLTEQPAEDPLRRARALHGAFTSALDVSFSSARESEAREWLAPQARDSGYLEALAATTRGQLTRLPAWPRVCTVAEHAGLRAAEAQARLHAAPALGDVQLEQWARKFTQRAGLGWREFLAGAAASVLACHALIVAAANPRTDAAEAARLDEFYLRLSALSTLLDAVIDRDGCNGSDSLLRIYHDRDDLAEALCALAQEACLMAEELPHGPHHLMIMAGVVAYYISAPQAREAFADPISRRLRHELSPLIFSTLAIMRPWRTAKRLRMLITDGGGGRWRLRR